MARDLQLVAAFLLKRGYRVVAPDEFMGQDAMCCDPDCAWENPTMHVFGAPICNHASDENFERAFKWSRARPHGSG